MCSNYATGLATNAEAAGIKGGVLLLCFKGGGTHMLNVFHLTDGRMMYVETTGAIGLFGKDDYFFDLDAGDNYLDMGTVQKIYAYW
ncbi:hypothetical protein MsAm2_10310 [Methanolapillus ohkumae]|uniref:Uncharacterized protein n=1 Tax=Methanolapillus ohkumae TaxID=3028298 RepID=A0AA96V634_9EURY|nr:hypothetical protein MsAm2_10310 [Methanosarcinaceae archaeon Am2]